MAIIQRGPALGALATGRGAAEEEIIRQGVLSSFPHRLLKRRFVVPYPKLAAPHIFQDGQEQVVAVGARLYDLKACEVQHK
jgi:hypothetical protein